MRTGQGTGELIFSSANVPVGQLNFKPYQTLKHHLSQNIASSQHLMVSWT